MNENIMYYYGYSVSDSGYIEIPVIDSVYIEGSTLDEAKRKIEKKSKEYLKQPQVIVKMAHFNFTLLGEVATPGVQTVYENNINLIEAVSYGGGITYNGDRQEVLIIRTTKEGTKTFEVDLTDNEIVKSDLYYVMPNDIIYVKPRHTTAFRQETSDYLFGISALSSVLTTALLIWRLDL
jgi:polysaccharide export outer membrane protein